MSLVRWICLASLLVVPLGVIGCTATPSPHHSRGGAISAPSAPSISPSPTPVTSLTVSAPPGGRLIGELSSQRGINQIGPFPVSSSGISIDVRCVGAGAVDVDVDGTASFSVDCADSAADPGIQNVVDVTQVDHVLVRVSGDDSLLWAAAVATAQD